MTSRPQHCWGRLWWWLTRHPGPTVADPHAAAIATRAEGSREQARAQLDAIAEQGGRVDEAVAAAEHTLGRSDTWAREWALALRGRRYR